MARRIKFRLALIVVLATVMVIAATAARGAPPAAAVEPCSAGSQLCNVHGRVTR